MRTNKTPLKDEKGNPVKAKWTPIKNGRGEIKAWIELFWSAGLNQWVSIPGVSQFYNEGQPPRINRIEIRMSAVETRL